MENQGANLGGHASVAAGVIVAYWLADGYVIGLPVAALAATWNPLIVFLAAVTIVISINLAACRWINTAWSSWANGSSGARIERQLDKVRPTRVGRAATRWIASDSDVRFAAAAALTCAIVAVTIGRSVGRPTAGRSSRPPGGGELRPLLGRPVHLRRRGGRRGAQRSVVSLLARVQEWREQMSESSTGNGKVVVNRAMSLDGFIAAPGHRMDWGGGRALATFVAPEDFAEIAAATGAMLIGRRTWDVGSKMEAEDPGSVDYPFSGPFFLLTHRPPEQLDPGVTVLSGDIGEAVATALSAGGGKNLEILGADVAGQCLERGLVDEILVYVLPVLLGDGIPFSSPGLTRVDLQAISSARSGDATILRFRVRR